MKIINKGIVEDLVIKCGKCGCAFEIETGDKIAIVESGGKPEYFYTDCPVCGSRVDTVIHETEVSTNDQT